LTPRYKPPPADPKTIAADSHVSVRTVESHLQRVYEKLGISSRRELADTLHDQPRN
jgi:DNA-binding NarL/FixJ family response regulator